MKKKKGERSFVLPSQPRIVTSASFVGRKEGEGPLGGSFDTVLKDDTLGLDSWEQAESRMLESAVRLSLAKLDKTPDDIDLFFGGDLLSQIISAGFAARELRAPFIGMYGACSTMVEAMISASVFVECCAADLCAAVTSSHF